MAHTVRLQIEIDRDRMEEVEDLSKLGGLKTKRELFNNALTLLKWAAREKSRGNSICSVSSNGQIKKELELPFLEAVASTVQRVAVSAAARANGSDNSEPTSEDQSLAALVGTGSLRLIGRT